MEFASRRDMERAMDKFDDYELNGRRIRVSKCHEYKQKSSAPLSSLSRTSRAVVDPEAAPAPGAGGDPPGRDPVAGAAGAGTLDLGLSVAVNLAPAPSLGEVDRNHPGVAVALDPPRRKTTETAQNPSLAPRIDPSRDLSLDPNLDPNPDPSRDPALPPGTRDQSRGSLMETRDPAPEVLVVTTARDRRSAPSHQWPTVTVRGLNRTLPLQKPPQRKMMKTNRKWMNVHLTFFLNSSIIWIFNKEMTET